jgi:hypothetical protein
LLDKGFEIRCIALILEKLLKLIQHYDQRLAGEQGAESQKIFEGPIVKLIRQSIPLQPALLLERLQDVLFQSG